MRKNFLILAMMVVWIWLLIWTFFGWSPNWDDPNIPQYTSTWFIETINNTWDYVDTWDLQINTWNTAQEQKTIEINVMMPKYFYNAGWKKFAQDLYDDKNIYMNFVFINDLNWYRDKLYDTKFSEADLFLYPYDRNEKVSTRSYEQNIEPYFDEILYPITQSLKVSFLPFAADPMVSYSLSWISTNNFYEISESVLDREPTIPLSFPLFFGVDTQDDDKSWFTREYQDIVRYALLHYFKTNNDSNSLELRIDSNLLEKYNIPDLRTISNAISAPDCKNFPSICFQIYNFVWLRFWFLSDYDVVNTYFTWKKSNFDKLTINTLPFSQLESPVRIRWWWIRGSLDDVKKINAIYILFKQYMDKHGEYNLRNSTLPVFRAEEWYWLIDNKYIWLRWYTLQAWWDYMDTLRNIDKFWELIWHQITAKEYLR